VNPSKAANRLLPICYFWLQQHDYKVVGVAAVQVLDPFEYGGCVAQ
jgi:hypothetical protein